MRYCWRQWHPIPVLLPGESHGQRSLVGCSPWSHEESDMTEWLHFHFSLSCIGEGNGNPLQYSRLENPRDWGALWAAVHWVSQSRTQMRRLSSSIAEGVALTPWKKGDIFARREYFDTKGDSCGIGFREDVMDFEMGTVARLQSHSQPALTGLRLQQSLEKQTEEPQL